MAASAHTPLAMGDAFRDTGKVLAQRGFILLLLSAALVATGGLAGAWLRHHPPLQGQGLAVGLANGAVTYLAQAAPHNLFIIAATWIAVEILQGRSPPLGDALTQGVRLFFPVLVVQLLYLAGMMAGMVLLVVPGIIVALMWVLVIQVMIVERLGIVDAFKRSRALTKGHRWALLGLFVLYTLLVVAIEWVIFRITSPGLTFVGAANAPVNAYGVVPLFTLLAAPLSSTVMAAIYLRLRDGHRGSADVTAEVFA